jgi:oxygen-independent coproporphyrinogen III oxidase
MAGIYIHIPFCKQACHYCDFHFSTNQSNTTELVAAICKEINLQSAYLGNEIVETIYFGGGTPSLLTGQQLQDILESLHKNFSISASAEITLEANPDDLSLDKLQRLKSIGVNRLSIGVQSFDSNILAYLNRAHTSADATACYYLARQAGFANISMDLIYAIPGLTDRMWVDSIKQMVELAPEHISSYSLTIEKKTVFGKRLDQGAIQVVHDDVSARQLEILIEHLEESNYLHYEVSNFSKSGFESRHNSSYWKQKNYLGLGPSAHSYNGTGRQSNISNNHLYLKAIKEGLIPAEKEILSRADHINEFLLTTLRTSWGCDMNYLKQKYHYDLMIEQREYLQTLFTNDLALSVKNSLQLTKKGRLLADKIASDLFFTEH